MANKLEQYTTERDKIAAKIAVLEERRKVLDGKIMETENLEIRAMMRSENLTLPELMELVRTMQEKHRTPYALNDNNDDDTIENQKVEDTDDDEI
ncbi:MAG TPA: DUF4315 family protein [Candidatus Limiplasma sp.]|nr:DUF4315 family protein [Candidatus Limiplasma sp.]